MLAYNRNPTTVMERESAHTGAASTYSTLLSLPAELRLAIYEYMLDDMLRMQEKLVVWRGGRRPVSFD